MAKFADTDTPSGSTMLITSGERALTHEGGLGFVKTPQTELYTMALSYLWEKRSFYENRNDALNRFQNLTRIMLAEDPAWVAEFISWLRNTANMRTASVVLAAEYACYDYPEGRRPTDIESVVYNACTRPDELGEIVGYIRNILVRRSIPKPVVRAINTRLNNMSAKRAITYGAPKTGAYTLGDVINLTHPNPTGPEQDELFQYLIRRSHGDPLLAADYANVPILPANVGATVDTVRNHTAGELDRQFGLHWKQATNLWGEAPDAEFWEKFIPEMGHMALIRQLAAFDKANLPRNLRDMVRARVGDPEEVRSGRQFPYRYLTARMYSSDMWASCLEDAMEISIENTPALSGKTLVMVDSSGSMTTSSDYYYNNRGQSSLIKPVHKAALFAAVLNQTSDCDTYTYDSRPQAFRSPKPTILATTMELLTQCRGGATKTWECTNAVYNPRVHDRIIVLSDMQDHRQYNFGHETTGSAPDDVPVYVWDLDGLRASNIDTNRNGHHLFTGFSDASFSLIPRLENCQNVGWPWEN